MDTETKSFRTVEFKAEPEGRFTALVATFDVRDKLGDIIRRGAFADTLADWRARGAMLPVIFSHEWAKPHLHIGECDPADVRETAAGLEARGRLYLDEPPAGKVFAQLRRKALSEWSFAFTITKAKELARGAREILGLHLIEIGPCLAGVGTTATLDVKADRGGRPAPVARPPVDARLASYEQELASASQRLKRARAEYELSAHRIVW